MQSKRQPVYQDEQSKVIISYATEIWSCKTGSRQLFWELSVTVWRSIVQPKILAQKFFCATLLSLAMFCMVAFSGPGALAFVL